MVRNMREWHALKWSGRHLYPPMYLSDHSLHQLDDAYVDSLESGELRGLSKRLLADLKEARERFNQTPNNSSRPPSSRTPWARAGATASSEGVEREPDEPEAPVKKASNEAVSSEAEQESLPETSSVETKPSAAAPARKPGKQPGAPGVGRTQVFEPNELIEHYPACCAGCGRAVEAAGGTAYTAFQAVDLRWGEAGGPGLRWWVTHHRYHEVPCPCGHHTREAPGRGAVDPLLAGVELRLVGPLLATLMVALSLRFRRSRARIQEFLHDWLGLDLSVGTIHPTLHEAAAAVAPAAEALIEAVRASELLHADETSWPEGGALLWLWIFVSATTTLYYIAGLGKELVTHVLAGFSGWLMTDGWFSYRDSPRRLPLANAIGAGLISCARRGGFPRAITVKPVPLATRCSLPSRP
jgi:transposase